MSIDPISGLSLLTTLFNSIANSLGKVKGSPKQRLGRDVYELFTMLEKLEENLSQIAENLKSCSSNRPTHLQIRALHDSIQLIKQWEMVGSQFFDWIREHTEFRKTLSLFAPEIKEVVFNDNNFNVSAFSNEFKELNQVIMSIISLNEIIDDYYRKDKKIGGSNNKVRTLHVPFNDFIIQVDNLLMNVRQAKKATREFAVENLSIDDIFYNQ